MGWRIRVSLNNIDVSENLINILRIEAEESTAKIAEFSIIPFSGLISVTKWIGKEVSIFYQSFGYENNLISELKLFQGIVDEPIYDSTTKVTTFICSDQLHEKVQNLDLYDIDQLIAGSWSPIVFTKNNDNWEYAQDKLSTIPASLDLDCHNQLQLTPWEAKQAPDFIFTEDDVFYQSKSGASMAPLILPLAALAGATWFLVRSIKAQSTEQPANVPKFK